MAVRSSVVTVSDTSVVLISADDADFDQVRRDVAIQNVGTQVAYLGGTDVTTINGYPLRPTEALALDGMRADSLPFAVAESGESTLIAVLEVGV